MLTPEQETARAVKASQLYGQPLPSELKQRALPSFAWRLAVLCSVLALIPSLFAVTVLRFYLNTRFGTQTDLGAASILIIIELGMAFALSLVIARFVYKTLSTNFMGARVSFWVLLVGVIGITYGAVRLTTAQLGQSIGDLSMHVGLFAAVFVPVALIWSLSVIFLCDRLAKR